MRYPPDHMPAATRHPPYRTEYSAGSAGMFLHAAELEFLTGKVRKAAQIKILQQMGIDHRVRPDGFPLVLRSHIDTPPLDNYVKKSAKKDTEPNWDALKKS